MKKIGMIIIFFIMLISLSSQASATDVEKDIVSSIDDELLSFKNSLPENVKEFFPDQVLEGNFKPLVQGDISEKSFIDFMLTYLTAGINDTIKSFASILALLILLSIFHTISSSMSESNLGNVVSICSTLCLSITVFNICNILLRNATVYIKSLCSVMNAFIPIMVALLSMSGNISSAVVSNGSMLLFISIVQGFLLVFMLPLCKMCLAFGCAKSLNNSLDLSGISKTVKTTFTSVTIFVMSIFMFVLSYKNTLSQSADTLSIKTARFAISSFVPLVGSSVNDAMRTVTSSLSFIKNSCGVIALISIAVIMLPILINLFLNKISFSILSSMSKAIGGGSEGAILEEADSVCGFVLTLVSCTCVLFIFALTIFLKTSLGGTG